MMNDIVITKKDIIWGYIAKFFLIASGLITLPLVLKLLTPEEIGMNYLLLTISSMVALLDFGFSPQFGRTFTYVHSGAQTLLKEGIEKNYNSEVNYHLLSVLLTTARYVYKRLSVVSLLFMLSIGTFYMYVVTEGFNNVNHALSIWILFSISTYFNIYFTYYNSLLIGSGHVAEYNKAVIFSKLAYILLCISFLFLHFGLFSIIIANFVSPFILRCYSYRIYFTKEMQAKLDSNISKDEIREIFNIIWHNAKKLGINFIGAYLINKSNMFLVGLFLPLSEVGSFGLMIQFTTIISSIAITFFTTYQPRFSYLRINNRLTNFKELMGTTVVVYWLIMILGSITLLFIVPLYLTYISANTMLPPFELVLLYLFVVSLEGNHSLFASLIVTDNKVPFVLAGLLSGITILVITFLVLKFTGMGLLGVVLTQLIVQLCYNNWRWPKWVLDEFKISFGNVVSIGVKSIARYTLRK